MKHKAPLRSGDDQPGVARLTATDDVYADGGEENTEHAEEVVRGQQLAERYRLEFIDMDKFRIDAELFRSIPADLMLRYGFVPHRKEGATLVIVVSDPSDLPVLDELTLVGQRVREGEALAASLAARGIFPPVAVKMVEVGESTGALQEMLTNVADFFDEEIDTQLGRFVTIIEPVLLVVMGVAIAALLAALYMPLLQIGSVLS